VQAVRVGSRGVFSENGHEPFEVQLFSEDYQVHRFAQMLAETDERPFFCYYNIYWPHMPLAHMPLAYQRRYGRDAVRLRANVPSGGQEPFDERWFHCYLWEHSRSPGDLQPITEQLPDGFDLGDLTALYYGAVTWVDDLVGALLERLEGAGLADGTIVVFTSDHGDNLGSHGDWNKDRFWEESIRIPWCMRGPGIDGGQVHRCEQAQLIDVMPTLLDCCGLPVPETVQGRSLLPILNGERADLDRPTAFIETGSYEICARTLSHKYVQRIQRPGPPIRSWLRSVADQEGRFAFDLVQDPYELDGRSALEDSTDLAAQVTRWDAETPWLN
jgi:choline-sulfatase